MSILSGVCTKVEIPSQSQSGILCEECDIGLPVFWQA